MKNKLVSISSILNMDYEDRIPFLTWDENSGIKLETESCEWEGQCGTHETERKSRTVSVETVETLIKELQELVSAYRLNEILKKTK